MDNSIAARLLSADFLEELTDAVKKRLRVRQLMASHPIKKSQKRELTVEMPVGYRERPRHKCDSIAKWSFNMYNRFFCE